MQRNEEKGGNYFWIKSPVDLFLFSASPLNLQLLYSVSLSSFLSISIVLKAFSVLHLLIASLFFFDFPWFLIPSLSSSLLCSASSAFSFFLSLLLQLIMSKYFICPKTLIRKRCYIPIMYTLITQGKRGQTHTYFVYKLLNGCKT